MTVRRLRLVPLAVLAAAVLLSPASPAGALLPEDASPNVHLVGSAPEMVGAISLAFIRDTMFVSTVHGVYSYDVSEPDVPIPLGALPMYIWENEDMDVDVERELILISRDPRGFTSPAVSGFPYGALHVIDVSDPALMRQVSFTLLPAGHTTTCVSGCDFVWTAGPAPAVTDPADWGGRPVFATDLRDPANPLPCPEPIDLQRNDGATDYAHDVQVDARGIAWVSGAGGVRGYWTEGRHRDPLTRKVRPATGCAPIPFAGGGTPEAATPSRFMHNAWRNVSMRASKTAPRGSVLMATEESVTSDCATSGRFATYDLRGSYGGQGWRDIERTKFRMRVLDTWTPEAQPGSSGCASAHYFDDRGDGLLAYAFYEQGVRFLDASNPRNIRQVGWWRADDSQAWAAYWHDGLVFVADVARGVEILSVDARPGNRAVRAPIRRPDIARAADPSTGYTCRFAPAALTP
jgi:hypothetical protein